jgi:hypothetical protein
MQVSPEPLSFILWLGTAESIKKVVWSWTQLLLSALLEMPYTRAISGVYGSPQ